MDNEDAIRPWERQPDETDAQWLAFRCYRDLGAARTIREAWAKYGEERGLRSAKPHPDFFDWKRENNWDERCRKYDHWQDRQHQQMVMEQRREAFEVLLNHAPNVAQTLVAAAGGGIEDLDSDRRQAITEVLDRAGIVAPEQIEVDATVESESTVEQTTEHSLDTEALQELDDDELASIESVLEKMTGGD